ncbi:MAG: glycosyltransferase family 4 protein [Candidatus Azambacteria bacterium]|nr:glycosyltransferase family 4 protein [Candidatus Azambacteria bacterium]
MKLLIITQKYDFNDSNLGVFIDWWDKLAEKTEKVYILALEKHSEPTKANMEVISMGKERGRGFLRNFFGFYAGLFKTIGKIDTILVHMIPKYIILAAPVVLIYKKPTYLWYTGVSVHWQLRLAVLFCKKVFTAHEAAMRINTPKRIITGHGIDVGKFQIPNSKPQIHDEITILSIGRITPSKGHDLIIKACADLIKSGYNLKLKIIGGAIQNYHQKYFEFLKKLVRDLKIDKRIEFSGPVSYDKMPEYFQNAEILINTVPFGGLDKVILEAMASGVIPLTSNSAFLTVFSKSIARNLVFKEGDIEDLKIKLRYVLDKKLYQDEALRYELRNIIVQNHNFDNLIAKIAMEMGL